MKKELPQAPINRIMKRNCKNMKISGEAKKLFHEALETEAMKLSKMAVELARADGRKTIQEKDIKRWKKEDESNITDDDFFYELNDNGIVHYNVVDPLDIRKKCTYGYEKITVKVLPKKFIKGMLLYDGELYPVNNRREAEKIMESHKQRILDDLMEPHWAYNIYEFRDWRPVEQIREDVELLTMWFDDYDGGDVFEEGVYFK